MAWRNLLRNKTLFTINIAGLSMGIATFLIIMLFIADELSFDRYNEKADRIARVVLKGNLNGEIIKEAVTPAPVAPTLKSEFPEVQDATRLKHGGVPKVVYDHKIFKNGKLAFIDPNFFQIFTIAFRKHPTNYVFR